jgi:hypothetical protein
VTSGEFRRIINQLSIAQDSANESDKKGQERKKRLFDLFMHTTLTEGIQASHLDLSQATN